jgi:two-component sensor histidine kinase
MRIPMLLIAWGLLAFPCRGQPSPADTTRVRDLLERGRFFLFKLGEEKVDLDSAMFFANQAAALSRRVGYPQGVATAGLLAGWIHIEAGRYPFAWKVYNILNDTSRIDLLANMLSSRIYDDKSTPANSDSVRRYATLLLPYLGRNLSPMATSSVYFGLAYYYYKIGNKKRSAELSREGLRRLQRLNQPDDLTRESEFLYRISYFCAVDSAFTPDILSKVTTMATYNDHVLQKMPDHVQRAIIDNIVYMGSNYYYAKHTDMTFRLIWLAVQLNERLHQHAALPYSFLSFLYTSEGKTKEGLQYALEAVRVSETPDGPVDGHGYEAAARTYFSLGDADNSLLYFYKALPLVLKDRAAVTSAGGLFRRAVQALLQEHKSAEALRVMRLGAPINAMIIKTVDDVFYAMATGDCFYALGRTDSAAYYYWAASKTSEAGQKQFAKIQAYNSLATLYSATGQYARARPLLDTITAVSNRAFSTFLILENAWFRLYEADSAAHDYARALVHLRLYQQLHDSLINVGKNKEIADINIKYETEKKNQHIADLEKQTALQTRLQQATVLHDRMIRNSLIGGSILLALLAAGVFSRYLAKQRTNRLMEVRQGEIDASNRQLQQLSARQQKLISEKEWLVREIHHRVKNNLQIVISLLHLQSEQLKDEIAISAFEDISGRINSISLVHRKLYLEGENLATISMRDYVSELVGHLRQSFNQRRKIHFQFEVGAIFLDVAQSVPIGLILNEAITNSIKYAFPTDAVEFPSILIMLREEERKSIEGAVGTNGAGSGLELIISDNGVGLKAPFDPETNSSLGMQLIHTMAQQLDGTLSMTNDQGLTISIRFQRTEGILEQG